jgi:hypothetical protein
VGDGDHRSRKLLQMLLQPGDTFGIEVVGGLVEQQEIGLFEQYTTERDSALLTAAQLSHVSVRRRQP